MLCYSCERHSLHTGQCPFCGAPDVRAIVGFDPLDLLNPMGLGKKAGDAYVNAGGTAPSVPSPQNIPGPYGAGYGAGEKLATIEPGGSVFSPFADIASTIKWLLIGGAVLAGGMIVFTSYQAWKHDIPGQAFRHLKESERERMKIAQRVAEKHL